MPQQLAWLLVRSPADMTETDLLSGLQQVPEVDRTSEFVQEFQTMVPKRTQRHWRGSIAILI